MVDILHFNELKNLLIEMINKTKEIVNVMSRNILDIVCYGVQTDPLLHNFLHNSAHNERKSDQIISSCVQRIKKLLKFGDIVRC